MNESSFPSPPSAGLRGRKAEVEFDFYGVRVSVSSASREVADDFRRDFAWFGAAPSAQDAKIHLELFLGVPPSPARAGDSAASSKKSLEIHDDGPVRTIDHGGRALVVYDFEQERGKVYSAEGDLLHELGYLLLLSRVGEFLDKRGFHRVHGLGFQQDGRCLLALLPVGGGKTTLALALLKDKSVRLLSEDTPLVDRRGRLWPFPVRFGISAETFLPQIPRSSQRIFHRRFYGTKVLVDIDFAAGRWATQGPVVPEIILIGGKNFFPESRLQSRNRLRAVPALLWNLWIGAGVPQGREYLLRPRPGAIWHLCRTAFSRALALGALLRRCRVYDLFLSRDTDSNVRRIEQLLGEKRGPK